MFTRSLCQAGYLVQTHRHGANEGLHSRSRLIVGGAEPATDVLVIKNLHFEGEIFLKVLDNHDQERQLDPQRLLRVGRTRNIVCAHIGTY